jgi:tetratricopeptide (TPR) repeat protein
MKPLQPPDTHFLKAAHGWLELGDHEEAGNEISRISPDGLKHPDVLETRWSVCAAGGSWETGLEVARQLVKVAPERTSGWIHQAYSIRRALPNGLEQAWEALLPVYAQFPNEPIIPYNLACYTTQFGRLEEAWDWLEKAVKAAGDKAAIHRMALADPDLEPLHEKIQELRNS